MPQIVRNISQNTVRLLYNFHDRTFKLFSDRRDLSLLYLMKQNQTKDLIISFLLKFQLKNKLLRPGEKRFFEDKSKNHKEKLKTKTNRKRN